ncbi:asparagine synthase (glutamine-hydrolyzing) [Rhodovulum adriaticum]|uniref:asparagine synthase (glutamine-hydrolyzing) n=1 Tax=Rhodovulum adriaticum TaxID=35804 RepID=A0A4R2P0A0_RHOAD|nr:asparagine synthase (glutamine-hydrolyzing) [Rhodovulum adriaticum]MBK1634198.1 asparagine synthase (glutamine-hydrolyzing) [Rhodovulum adriaticum]TCP27251.1 asparagine synthase (glutamine-hydrolysing) [Rhodovulum adriaticum]
MCGFTAILTAEPGAALPAAADIRAMTDALAHRGPDAEGHWSDPAAGIALGHRRLSILDLSEAGAQPMHSACGRYALAFNGEIYNHPALREELAAAGHAPGWRGQSDTETLLALIAARGLAGALRATRGMFALALWDRQDRTLSLARDRMGEKPLYYGQIGGVWAAASELHALRCLPGCPQGTDRAAVAAYLARGYVPEGMSIHAGITKLAPGRMVVLRAGAAPEESIFEYFAALAAQGRAAPMPGDAQARSAALEEILRGAVGAQMISDVPLGCFLSGGVDSSLVAALMQADSARQVETFSVGFSDARFDESPHAAAVARHLGTAHTAFRLSEAEALAVIPDLPHIYDEPFADSSQIPTALLCRAARSRVTVALTGDGADELFGGYNRHVLGPRLWRLLAPLPRPLRRPLGRALAGLEGLGTADRAGRLHTLAKQLGLPVTLLDKLARLGGIVAAADGLPALYTHLTRGFLDPAAIMAPPPGAPVADPPLPATLAGLTGAEWLMAQDSLGYLPGDILTKVDRAAMATSLETRAPFLDPQVVRAAWSLAPGDRIDGKRGKAILRGILARHVPGDLVERPKQGFAVPLDRWLREGLRDWAEALLTRDTLLDAAGLDRGPVAALWTRHQARHGNEGQKLWTLLMLLAWLERDAGKKGPA